MEQSMTKTMYLPRNLCRGAALFAVACATVHAQNDSVAVPAGFTGMLPGYLAASALPNSLAMVPAVPAADSSALMLDKEISRRSFLLRDTARWALAKSDANLSFPHAAGTFSCALNAPVSETATPRLYKLLRRTLADLGGSTYAAKIHYNRARPFIWNQEPICTPNDQAMLAKDGSYPSGHTAAGWGWALILAEISPAQSDAILLRGLSFGESRNVCNAHWHSDVVQARSVAAGTLARLHVNEEFGADLAAAKDELATARNKGMKPDRDCAAEAAALAIKPSLAQ
jgi:acid phosphatase (class A)